MCERICLSKMKQLMQCINSIKWSHLNVQIIPKFQRLLQPLKLGNLKLRTSMYTVRKALG